MEEVRLGSRTLQPRRQLMADGERLPIGKRALDILSVLAEAGGEIVTKDELLDAVWPGVTVEENALQVHVAALRKALGPEADRLKTIRGVGYQLEIDPEIAAATPQLAPDNAETAIPREPASAGVVASPAREPPVGPSPLSSPASTSPRLERGIEAARSWARSHRLALTLGILLAVLAGTWANFGSELGLRPQERIPVLVRELAVSGGGDPTEGALAGGITDELISRLRRLPDLRVATAAPDGTAPSGTFDNAYVVDGTIRSSGDRLQVNVRLSDAQGEVLWSETLDRDIADLFDMQEEIAAAIAGALSVSFDVGADSVAYGGTDNPEAYAAYMQYWKHRVDFDQSVQLRYLERAVALDPDFGKAITGLALNYGYSAIFAGTNEQAEELLAKADETSARALATNPDLSFAQAARGYYFLSRRDFGAAHRHMRRAAELDRGDDPNLRSQLATYAIQLGRFEQSMSLRDSNELIDPIYRNDPWHIFNLMYAGRHEEAIELFDRLSRYEERNLQPFAYDAYFAYLLAGREDDGQEFADRLGYDFAERLRAFRAEQDLPTMSRPQLRQWLNENLPGGANQVGITVMAAMAAYEGHDRLAVDLLRIAYERPGGVALLRLWHPVFADARKTDAFEKLVTDLGLVKAWRESGDWGDFCRPVSGGGIACS